jgi:hypothetical protein
MFLGYTVRYRAEAPCGNTWASGVVRKDHTPHPTCFAEALWRLVQPVEKHRGPG